MNLNQQDFREAMSYCAAGVYVMTTDGVAGRFGITMTAVTAVTDTPPTLLLCVNKQSAFGHALLKNGVLCVNVLSAKQQDLAEHFAGLTRLTPAERFEQHIWHRGKTGQLQVEGALAHLHASVALHQEMGTHHVFFVKIDDIRVSGSQDGALMYFRRAFATLDSTAT